MWYPGILLLFLILFAIATKKRLNERLAEARFQLKNAEIEYDLLCSQDQEYRRNNDELKRNLDTTIALYEITKELCRSLDENEIFKNFLARVPEHVTVDECYFLRDEKEKEKFTQSELIPLKIGKGVVRYLALKGLRKEGREKFEILTQQFLLGLKRAILYERVQELAAMDGLTSVFGRRFLLERLKEELERSKKFNYTFSFLMIDIDRFKEQNDRFGHLVGDAILREVSKAMKENVREIDAIGRYGGEEFSVILTETDRSKALAAAQRIRQAIEARRIRAYDEEVNVTVSIGVSVFPQDAQDTDSLIEKADQALYKAKQEGRNRVC